MIPPWFQECLYWMKSVIWRHLLDLFHRSNWSDPYVKDIVSISEHLLQPSILLQAVCGWFEWYVYLRKAIVALLFYWGVYLFHRTTCSDICLKSSVLKELVATPLFVGECVNLQFHNSNCSYSLSVVNFSKEQLQTFAFARVTFGTTTFSKELLFL